MSAQDKLGGYASGFTHLDADEIADNVTSDYMLLDQNGIVHSKEGLQAYITGLREHGDKMDITEVMVDGGKAWCKWQVGEVVGAGLISFGDEGVTQEQLFFL
ncbi:nuclear transport factor 2 family protein [Photobacterium rosenbergii]|uniref:SnoaL-like domain-containing protein n=1 Tax=Photobacterium rosenbergii TaxID=294936 RepID=A0A2T3NI34_9GAMM|nr:nuclear transport factor 2 family protein [Photobacterium rosenbergii]MBY5947836.1 nuclear transport factor 2 family protein [Photobacterium rosenbergii]PSW14640.1 hypothetical protein C9J01_09480 [Photobacterium rosenbergii]